ncbi:hypothetical protein DFH05DRAFT_731652 [Lentinula detonsa]|uniref:F-box domain-containing protein n=1 Tax=Lentinula detonsa TaxID=2804962 RepID=A0A9W8TSY5_9AGAR|nr:hypothetical protein DFH05DRAFT_731652 [Lentinula detonsa]
MANLNDEVAIYQFPFEVFHSIFGYLVSEDRHQLEAGTSQKPIASFTISQVSQRWRDIALGLPFIWTNIRIFHFRDSQRAMVKELLVRTKGLPLSITLKYNKPLTAAQNKNCWDILLEIMSCASRWETLRIAVNEDLFAQICGNFGGRQAPILQRLELIILGFGKWQPHRRMSPFIVSPLYLELSHTHLLRHLVLFGVRLRMPSPTYMEKLEVLSLDYTPGMDMLDRPSLPAESPPLQTRLRDLSLPDVTTLFKHLPTITLREFSLLDVDFAFWNGFLNSMVGPDPRYPAVEKLCLQNTLEEYSVQITQLPLTDFIQGFPKLEILDLYNVHHITNSLKQCAIFPCIHTLRVRGLRYRDLCEVDTPPLLDLSSLSWLQRKVPNFKRDPMDKAY